MRIRRKPALGAIATFCLLMTGGAAAALSAGPEIPVNATTASYQRSAAIAPGPGGGFTAAWASSGQDGSLYGVYARRFDASGAPLGGEIPVNTFTLGQQQEPAIAAVPGGFVVTWTSYGQDGGGYGVYARRFDASGAPLGGEILVNTTTVDFQYSPAIAALAGGGFAIAWASNNQDGSAFGAFARRFDAAGNPLTGEISVNTTTAGSQISPAIAADPAGGFTVTWIGQNQDGDGFGVYARRFDPKGVPIGGELAVNAFTAGDQIAPAIAPSPGGGFRIAWASFGQDGSSYGVYTRRFGPDGAPLGGELAVNATTLERQTDPAIAAGSGDGFTVSWTSDQQDGDSYGIFARRFDAGGDPLGGEIPVNLFTAGHQQASAIAPGPGDGFTVAWDSDDQDGDKLGVFARRFELPAAPAPAPPAAPPTAAPGHAATDPPPVAAAPAADSAAGVTLLGRRLRFDRRGAFRLRLRCPAAERSSPCRGTLRVRTRAKLRLGRGGKARHRVVLARGRFRIAAGRTRAVRMRLRGRKLGLLRHSRRARRVVALAAVRDGAGNRATVRRAMRLVPRRHRDSRVRLVGFVPDRLSVAAAADGSVYLANPVGNGQVQRFGADGTFLGAWGDYGRLPAGSASASRALAAGPTGEVYVAERPSAELRVLSPDGQLLREWQAGFEDIAVDAAGNVYGLGAEVTKLGPDGAELATWELPDVSFGGALGIAVTPTGGVYVADTYGDRVLKLDAGGALVAVIGGRGHGDGRFVFPYDVATDAAGNVYVADTGNDRVQKFSSTGAFVAQWGGPGRGRGRFYTPTSIATDPAGNVYVADAAAPFVFAAGSARVQRFTPAGDFLAQWWGLPAAPRPRLFASVGSLTARRSATFRFRVGRTADGFVCRLGGERVPRRLRRAHRCVSPQRYAGLRPGRKVFSVTSLVGSERSTSAIRSWRILPGRGAAR